MSAPVKGDVERLVGRPLPARVHRDGRAAAALDTGAPAAALGEHLIFAPGKFKPNSLEGDALIAHELAHVAQQAGFPVPGARLPQELGASTVGGPDELAANAAAAAVLAYRTGVAVPLTAGIAPAAGGLRLQRCGPPAPPAITDPFVLALQAKLAAGDKPGFFADIRGLGGSKAGDASLRDGILRFQTAGKITAAEAFRAVALQELGKEATWPLAIKNIAEGLDTGVFTLPAVTLPPAGSGNLLEFVLLIAGRAAEGTAPIADYKNRFNAKWEIPPYSGLPVSFNPGLDSKGPRNDRARRIFNDLYAADPAIRTAYDADTPAGFRNAADTYALPDSTNLIASPRLQELRALFNRAPIAVTGVSDPAFIAFSGTVLPKALPLTADDREQIRRSQQWRLTVEGVFSGTPEVVSQVGSALLDTILSSLPPVAAPPPAAPVPAGPVPVPNKAQTAFLAGVHLTTPTPTFIADKAIQSITFNVKSAVPNPALAVQRRLAIDPAARVSGSAVDEVPWPAGISSVPLTVDVTTAAAAPGGATVFTARLTLPPLPVAKFAEQSVSVTVVDHRLDWFKANVRHGLKLVIAHDRTWWAPGMIVRYAGGQLPVEVEPSLPAANPDLTIYMRGVLKRGGVVLAQFAMPPASPVAFPQGSRSSFLGSTIVPSFVPPSAVPDPMELTVEFLTSPVAGAPAVHTIVLPFAIDPAAALPMADAALMTADNATLNLPIATAGSLLKHMVDTGAPGSPEDLVAHAVAAGTIKVKAMFVRSDSAAWLRAQVPPIDPANFVAYAMGEVNDPHTYVDKPGAAGWSWPKYPDTVFLNLTPDPTVPGTKRTNAALSPLLAHEGIHAADIRGPTPWDRYQMEFRAYWIQGIGGGLSTDVNPAMDPKGPKSLRARAIFEHVYNMSLYAYVKSNYDPNIDHFREKVDALVTPDAINMALSQGLRDLRTAVENTAPAYAARKADVTAKFAACTAADKDQVKTNRAWRDLVESKFTGTVRVSWWPPRTVPEATEIKGVLGIPL